MKNIKNIKTTDLILIIMGIILFLYILKMISLFEQYGAIPDTLTMCVFGLFTGECGILGWIKTTKEKNKDYEREKEAYERLKQDQEMREYDCR